MKTLAATLPLIALGACQLSTAAPNLYQCGPGDGGDCSEIAGTECCWDHYCHFKDTGCPAGTTGTSGFGNSSGGSTTHGSTSAGSTGHASSTGAAPSSSSTHGTSSSGGGATSGGSSPGSSSSANSTAGGTTSAGSSSAGSSTSNGGSTTSGGGSTTSGGASTGATGGLGATCTQGNECQSGSCCGANDGCNQATCCQPIWASAVEGQCCSGNANGGVCVPGALQANGYCTDDCQCQIGQCSSQQYCEGSGISSCSPAVGTPCNSDQTCFGPEEECQGPPGSQVCCLGSGYGCRDSIVCCSGVCDPKANICDGEYPVTAFADGGPRCSGSGKTCYADEECCSGMYCNAGSCGTGPTQCTSGSPVGHPCSSDSDCCSLDYPETNVCEGPAGHEICCLASGATCGESSVCCSGVCTTNILNGAGPVCN